MVVALRQFASLFVRSIVVSPLLHPKTTGVTRPLTDIDRRAGDKQAPQVARVLRAVTEDNSEKEEKS